MVIITGKRNKSFISGADIKEVKEAETERTELIREGQLFLRKLFHSSKITIAAINGYAFGGGFELALACDIRIASNTAKLGFPEVTLGVMPGFGGTQLLPRIVAMGMAKYLILTGAIISAREALRIGLIHRICKQEELENEVKRIVKRLSKAGPLALKSCKKAISEGISLPIDEAFDLEIKIYDTVARS